MVKAKNIAVKLNVERKNQLLDIFGEKRVSSKQADLLVYAKDQWPRLHLELRAGKNFPGPDFVVWPANVEEISKLLRLAREVGFPVVPYGGGGSTTGAAYPPPGSVVLEMKQMSHILDINEQNMLVVVETGIIGQHLETRLAAKGYTLGHFPSSMYFSSLGGFLAMRSAGQSSSKYGKIEDMVSSLLAVLPDGNIYRSKRVPRSATGPNLDQVLIGSGGTLAVLAQATLRIHQQPVARNMCGFLFHDLNSGLQAMRQIMRKGIKPGILRLWDRSATQNVLSAIDYRRNTTGCLMVVITEGNKQMAELEMELAGQICRDWRGSDLGEEIAKHWWDHRFAAHYEQSVIFNQPGTVLDTVELAATWSKLPLVYQSVKQALETQVNCPAHFCHAYPSGCSVTFKVSGRSDDPPDLELYDSLWDEAMSACLKAGGVISHHRGVGLLKAPYLPKQLGASMKILRGLKARLDPDNILNPGKMGL